jgi:biotin carboxylase
MAHLLVIELPGGEDTDLLRAALERGDEFTFLTSDLAHYRSQSRVWAMLARALGYIEVNDFEYAHVERRVLAVHSRHPIEGVLCLLDIRLCEAAQLAHRLGLPYLNPRSAALLRDKYRVRCRLAERGIAQPDFALADSNEALADAVGRLGLPALIKPADGYGSQNVLALRHASDLDPLLAPLDHLLPTRADYGLGVRANERLVVERLMTGTVIGCDTLTRAGRHTLLGVHEKQFFEPPSFAIRGGCFTPNGPRFEGVERYVFSALDAVEFDWGAAHVEVMLTPDGPRLIEINPRLVGARIGRLVSLSLGRCLHSDLISLHLGGDPTLQRPPPAGVAVSRWIVADEEGVLDFVETPDVDDPHIRCIEIVKRHGAYVRPPIENADRLGFVMVCAPDAAEAVRLAEDFISRCKYRLLPARPPDAVPSTDSH